MATQPNNPIVRVAQQDTILPSTQLNNKILPSTSVINVGYDANELVAAENLNYIFDNFGKWLTYLKEVGDSQIGAGDGLQTTSSSIAGGQVLSVDNTVVRQDRTITAGDGITGGGNLEENRTLTLGTPSTVGDGSDNSVTSTSHTHNLTLTSANIAIETGNIAHGGTIPLPVGYTQEQCKWTVSVRYAESSSGDIRLINCSANSNRVVTMSGEDYNGTVNYIIIGVK